MKGARIKALWSILRGVLAAAAATLLGMLLLAAAVIYLEVSDGALMALNQALKLLCVALGARFAVGVGGERGFFTGAAVGLLYMALGYVLYWQLGGVLFSAAANRISEEKHRAYEGSVQRVLVDGADGRGDHPLTARTKGGRLVHMRGDASLVGQFVDVKITGSNTWALYGEEV